MREFTGVDSLFDFLTELDESPFGFLSHEIQALTSELGLKQETGIQSKAFPAILNGENVLLISPTGSGKTEAAILPILQSLIEKKDSSLAEGTKLVYITPLRALNRDMLERLSRWAERLGLTVDLRHGDTSQSSRRKQALHPPDFLITTPETLQAILVGDRLRTNLAGLRWVIIDEIHELASDRRGSQLSIALERLAEVTRKKDFQRIGLSATVSNKLDVASFLCGTNRRCTVIDTSSLPKSVSYKVEFIEPTTEDELKSRELYVSAQTMARLHRIADLVDCHEKTLIFVNSRTNAELLSSRFAMMGLRIAVHHGSLPREEREKVERDFKNGNIRALVCTSTLELGIDIGEVDLVVQYMSPRQVNPLIQRVGRSGHRLSKTSEGITLAVTPEDALESIVISLEAEKKQLEPVTIHNAPLDVLAHQIAGILLVERELNLEGLLGKVSRAFPYRNLSENQLRSVVEFMEKLGFVGASGRNLFPKRKCREYYFQNLSMIPDERRYNVIDIATNQKIGILGEEFMMIHAKIGVHFIIKGRVWQIEAIEGENVHVTRFDDPTAAVPGWDGELMPIPESVASRVGKERSLISASLAEMGETSVVEATKSWPSDRSSRACIISELKSQLSLGPVPTDQRLVVEKFDRFLIVHTSAGDRINLTLGEFFEEILLREGLIRHWWNDGYRILIELTTGEFDVSDIAARLLKFDQGTPGFLRAVIRKHFPFGYYMKFIAERFGALKRGMMLSEEALKELTVKFRFTPIFEETLREAEQTKIDIEGALRLLKGCTDGTLEVACFEAKGAPSPLAKYIMSRYAEFETSFDDEDNAESMRSAIENEIISLLCFDCSNLQEYVRMASLDVKPRCPECGSSLLAVIFFAARYTQSALQKKRKGMGERVSGEEAELLSKARRSADLVLAYGRKGVIAQCVYGVGPQTASKVLSKMQETDEEFYNDLLQAKLKFIQTKPYWD